MKDYFEIRLIQGGVLVKREQGADPFQVESKTAGFIRQKYGDVPENRR